MERASSRSWLEVGLADRTRFESDLERNSRALQILEGTGIRLFDDKAFESRSFGGTLFYGQAIH
jgi:hypothetical protein